MQVFSIEKRKIKASEYQTLRETTGWSSFRLKDVNRALANDLFSVCIKDHDKIIGMGRVIGDGVLYFYIQDVIVLPEYQGKGVGHLIMKSIESFIAETAIQNSFIGLMSAKGVKGFYKKYGYLERPDAGPGMYKLIEH